MKIITNPANVRKLEAQLLEVRGDHGIHPIVFPSVSIIADPYIPPERESGRYVLPSGRVVEESEVMVCTRFVDYGPEDLPWLLYAGLVKPEMVALFYLVDDWQFRVRMDYGPVLPRRPFVSMAGIV